MFDNKSHKEWLTIHNRAAWDYIHSEWLREVLFGARKKQKKLFSPVTGNVLDMGCGYGMNFSYLTNAAQIIGIDFSPIMVEKARAMAGRSNVPIEIRQGDAEALDFSSNSFGSIQSSLLYRRVHYNDRITSQCLILKDDPPSKAREGRAELALGPLLLRFCFKALGSCAFYYSQSGMSHPLVDDQKLPSHDRQAHWLFPARQRSSGASWI
jgi:SAM-dependent methyltransferase